MVSFAVESLIPKSELGIHGIERIVELKLNTEEKMQFERSINSVKNLIETLKNDFF